MNMLYCNIECQNSSHSWVRNQCKIKCIHFWNWWCTQLLACCDGWHYINQIIGGHSCSFFSKRKREIGRGKYQTYTLYVTDSQSGYSTSYKVCDRCVMRGRAGLTSRPSQWMGKGWALELKARYSIAHKVSLDGSNIYVFHLSPKIRCTEVMYNGMVSSLGVYCCPRKFAVLWLGEGDWWGSVETSPAWNMVILTTTNLRNTVYPRVYCRAF